MSSDNEGLFTQPLKTQSLKINLATLPQNDPDNNKNNDGADAAPAQFVGTIPCNKSAKYIVHIKECLKSDTC